MRMRIEYSKKAAKYIGTLDKPTKRRIKEAIEGLTEQPPEGDIKTMQGFADGRLRLRVGKYRVVYKYIGTNAVVLYIIEVGSRGDTYK